MKQIKNIDAHCHADEFSLDVLKRFIDELNMIIVGVGMDFDSSQKIYSYSRELKNLIPCVGIHPWNIGKTSDDEVNAVLELARNVRCLGEIGLDLKFVPKTINKQRDIFKMFLELASEGKKALNIHSVNTWEETLNLLREYDIRRALFHWYTGPLNILKEISEEGYFITINPSVKFQKKHRVVVEKAPIEIILTESDGPYRYRGVNLNPELIPSTIKEIAKIKDMEEEEVREIIYKNFQRMFLW